MFSFLADRGIERTRSVHETPTIGDHLALFASAVFARCSAVDADRRIRHQHIGTRPSLEPVRLCSPYSPGGRVPLSHLAAMLRRN